MSTAFMWDTEVLHKYGTSGPRYTSYPTANLFRGDFGVSAYLEDLEQLRQRITPVSLYLHIPFCQKACFYCGCNRTITRDRGKIAAYVDALLLEIEQAAAIHGHRRVRQLHWGGGTPSYLEPAEITQLMHAISSHFDMDGSSSRDYSIELDPRSIDESKLALLKGLGFNRLSMGIQDFDSQVQSAINRRQEFPMVERLTRAVRRFEFSSLNFDLIYGLPKQTEQGISDTLDKVLELSPDRIACYNYAHMPDRFPAQRAILASDLPEPSERIDIYASIGERLTSAGYEHIGMDHFARKDDELCKAAREGSLQRNFQGYSRALAEDLVGLGASSISQVGDFYVQNERDPEAYVSMMEQGSLPIIRGIRLSEEDKLRRYVIQTLICRLRLDKRAVNRAFSIDFNRYFSGQLQQLKKFEEDGLVELGDTQIRITEAGRLVLRNICMLFDQHLGESSAVRFSKTI